MSPLTFIEWFRVKQMKNKPNCPWEAAMSNNLLRSAYLILNIDDAVKKHAKVKK